MITFVLFVFIIIYLQKLIFYSAAACFKQPKHTDSHSVGSIILLILGIAMLIYFILGYVFRYYMYGMRGIEAFPNYEFWMDLPALVKDGITFVQNGFKQVPAQDSYETI